MRIVIIGRPGTGKTTKATQLAASVGGPVLSTDDVMHLDWSEASEVASQWFDKPGPWIVEGVAVPRALRKWHERNPGQPPPVDKVIYLQTQHRPLTAGQERMGKGIETVLTELDSWLRQVVWSTA